MDFGALRQHIEQHYSIKKEFIPLSARQITLTVVEQPDDFLEAFTREDSGGRLHPPYWMYLWASAVGLCHHLERMVPLTGQRVLDLGCGFGLAGIVACQSGASVLFTDYEREALRFAQYNAVQNRCADRATFLQMDWNAPCLKGKFSRILASDVIYEAEDWHPILTLIQTHLAPDGEVILSEPNRNSASPFFKIASSHGFGYEEYGYTVCLEDDPSTITVYCMKSI